jgi:hypothetical protein
MCLALLLGAAAPAEAAVPPDGSLVRGDGPAYFMIQDGQRRLIEFRGWISIGMPDRDLVRLGESELISIPRGPNHVAPPFDNMTLVKGPGPDIFVLRAGSLHWVSPAVYDRIGKPRPRDVANASLDTIPKGGPYEPPLAILINGWGNGNIQGMAKVIEFLHGRMLAEYGVHGWDIWDGPNGRLAGNDSTFLNPARDYIRKIPPARRMIVLGHSFGGDDALKLAARVQHRIDFLGVYDPVTRWGVRDTHSYHISTNVGYFFNRWQENQPFPHNFHQSGLIHSVDHGVLVNQRDANISRTWSGEAVVEHRKLLDLGGFFGGPSKIQKRNSHTEVPSDQFVQTETIRALRTAIPEYCPVRD